MECFAQLVGTVLSLWEAAALDAAGENDEVIPTFLNLTDSSIRMVGIHSRSHALFLTTDYLHIDRHLTYEIR